MQNKPTVFFFAEEESTLILGSLNSDRNRRYRIEFFSSSTAGEAEEFLGYVEVLTNAAGNVSFSFSVPQVLTGFVTATATDLVTGDTSELG